MNRFGRALTGAFMGAFVVLVAHPESRPIYLGGANAWGAIPPLESDARLVDSGELPNPIRTPSDAAVWVETGAVRIVERRRLRAEDLDKLVRTASFGMQTDPTNAYWPLMKSVLIALQGNQAESLRLWLAAPRCSSYNDYQGSRLSSLSSDLKSRGAKAWRWAALYFHRSLASARLIEMRGRQVVKASRLGESDGLRVRFATLANGVLVRDGARNIEVGRTGSDMVEFATFPRDVGEQESPKRLLMARDAFTQQLRSAGMNDQADEAQAAFQTNEAWFAFASGPTASENFVSLAEEAVAVAVLPVTLLVCSLAGGLLWMFGAGILKRQGWAKLIQPPISVGIGLVLAVVVYAISRLWLATVAIATSWAFTSLGPEQWRSKPPGSFGPLFRFVLLVIGLGTVATMLCFVAGLSTPANYVLNGLGTPREYFGGSTVFLALSAISLMLVFLVGPTWAIVQRVDTTLVLGTAIRDLGKSVTLTCLFLSIAAGPVCIALDRNVERELGQIVANEPLYYYRLYHAERM